MDLEPWQLMLALSGLLIVIGILAGLGISEPAEIATMMVFVALFLGLTYFGYRIGKVLGNRGSG